MSHFRLMFLFSSLLFPTIFKNYYLYAKKPRDYVTNVGTDAKENAMADFCASVKGKKELA